MAHLGFVDRGHLQDREERENVVRLVLDRRPGNVPPGGLGNVGLLNAARQQPARKTTYLYVERRAMRIAALQI
jgi:hypothetical protein